MGMGKMRSREDVVRGELKWKRVGDGKEKSRDG